MASSTAVAGRVSVPGQGGVARRHAAAVALRVAAALALLALDVYVARGAAAPDADALANVED